MLDFVDGLLAGITLTAFGLVCYGALSLRGPKAATPVAEPRQTSQILEELADKELPYGGFIAIFKPDDTYQVIVAGEWDIKKAAEALLRSDEPDYDDTPEAARRRAGYPEGSN